MPVNSNGLGLGKELCTSLEERPEDRLRIMEVVMYDINQERIIHQVGDELVRCRVGLVHRSPLFSKFVSFIFPCHETDGFHNGGLDNLFPREDTPGHSVRTIRVCVGAEVTILVDHVVSDVRVSLYMGNEQIQEAWTDEEFKVRLGRRIGSTKCIHADMRTNLLVDITMSGTPAENFIIATRPVYGGLGING